MELSASNTKKFLIFSYISGSGNQKSSLHFRKTETLKSSFFEKMEVLSPISKTKKIALPKSFLYIRKRKCLSPKKLHKTF